MRNDQFLVNLNIIRLAFLTEDVRHYHLKYPQHHKTSIEADDA
jgi:hypothetical protein